MATMMPIKESDPACNNKKLHIGNNYVTIVYNDSGEDYSIGTLTVRIILVKVSSHHILIMQKSL